MGFIRCQNNMCWPIYFLIKKITFIKHVSLNMGLKKTTFLFSISNHETFGRSQYSLRYLHLLKNNETSGFINFLAIIVCDLLQNMEKYISCSIHGRLETKTLVMGIYLIKKKLTPKEYLSKDQIPHIGKRYSSYSHGSYRLLKVKNKFKANKLIIKNVKRFIKKYIGCC